MKRIYLKPGREKSLLRKHPWVFSGAINLVEGNPQAGDSVSVYDQAGAFLAWGTYSPDSAIRTRIWSWTEQEPITTDLIRRRLSTAITKRKDFPIPQEDTARRLVNAESDQLPGLVVDQYANVAVVQFLSWSAEKWRAAICDFLLELPGIAYLYERSDVDVRTLEGLPPQKGNLGNSTAPGLVTIIEGGISYQVDIHNGQKTGFYLDQRPNRKMVSNLARGKEVLNCFSYTGGFTLSALRGGAAQVTSLDTSAEALETLNQNIAINRFNPSQSLSIQGDAFLELRKMRDKRASFDMIILDPPKFAPTASQVAAAARGYKDINLLALKLLRPGGYLVTFSCSGGVTTDLFQKIIADAALDAQVNAQILYKLTAGADHPVALNFPEGEYLKGLVIQKG